MLWYTVTVVVRLQQGYSITTLELTTITFAVVMLATSAMWFLKPQISTITKIHTRNECRMEAVRDFARHQVRLPQRCCMILKDLTVHRCRRILFCPRNGTEPPWTLHPLEALSWINTGRITPI